MWALQVELHQEELLPIHPSLETVKPIYLMGGEMNPLKGKKLKGLIF